MNDSLIDRGDADELFYEELEDLELLGELLFDAGDALDDEARRRRTRSRATARRQRKRSLGSRARRHTKPVRKRGRRRPSGDSRRRKGKRRAVRRLVRRRPAIRCPVHGTEFVRWVQSVLNEVLGEDLRVNGVMNRAAREALRRFQVEQGLPADGIAGPDTEDALRSARLALVAGRATPAVDGGDEGGALEGELELRVDRTSRAYVRWVQASLNAVHGTRLDVDGLLGPLTRSAVRSFQQAHGLAVDGIVGPVTEGALVASGAAGPPGWQPEPAPSEPDAGLRARLARRVLYSPHVQLWPYSPITSRLTDSADAASNVRDAAAGRQSRRSSYESAPGGVTYLDTRLLQGILALAQTFDMRITSIAGGEHSTNSRHYAGLACDVDTIDGARVAAGHPSLAAFLRECRRLGATEVLGPGTKNHSSHVHVAWPRRR